jgi:FkbM family methyltransferase
MGIGAKSSFWRRALFRLFASRYYRRKYRTSDGEFEVFVSPSSSLGVLDIRKSLLDPVHERFIREWIKSDAVVWDIGSNLGLFALPAALKAKDGQVYAFEPDLELAGYLLRSSRLRKNKKLDVSVVCVAISNTASIANFQISKFSRAMNKLEAVGKWHDDQVIAEEVRSVPTMCIDTIAKVLAPPTVLKIDVEGAEIEVLQGGEGTISTHRPTILIEGPRELWEPLQAFFDKHHYALFDAEAEGHTRLSHPVWNTIAVPEEKLANLNPEPSIKL